MVRHRKKKRPQPASEDNMRNAVRCVVQRGQTIRETATETGIPKSTLARYVAKAKQFGLETTRLYPCYATARVLNDVEEAEVKDYLLLASKHHHGLTTKAARNLAFQYAGKNNKKMPPTRETNRQAGEDWLLGFMSRHPCLSVRKPKATSLSRATSFNKKNVGDFFDNVANVMEEYTFQPGSIYNCNETGLTTVHNPPKVIGDKKAKQIGQINSGERGTLVTMLGAINAQGNSIPPFLVFPRVYFKDHMITNAPPGTKGVAHQSGWMTATHFAAWMDHFIDHSHCSQDNKVLLLLDNHDSHISVNALDKAKANGIVMLTFPPHCSHKLQPLDRTVYGPLKKYFHSACNSWLLNHPGQPMTIYDIAPTMREAYPRAFCPRNIVSGFRVSGIYPFNRDIFKDDEFLSGFVSDRPEPVSGQEIANEEIDGENTASETETVVQEHPSNRMADSELPGTNEQGPRRTEHFSPEQVRPFPKAGPRKQTRGGRKKGKTLILTDTPVKEQIEKEFKEREDRQTSKAKRKVV